jgi:DNA-binding CsgD family transcriptional regulator
MLRSARDALHNILAFSIYCDDAVGSTEASSFDETLTADLSYSIRYSGDALLRAAFEVHRGRLDTALAVIKRARSGYQGEMFAWTPEGWTPFFATFEARLLFKSGRFAEAENVAAEAARHWERARLSPGAALRVRAEALEALGRRSEAISVAYDALDALKPISPVHHLLSAYACAYRLTRQRSFAGPLSYLKRAVHRRAPKSFQCTTSMPVGFVSQRLTPRERQVALLVADRHTNPEIAQRLGLSSKTVAHHVAAVFERLGLRARWQVTHDLLKSNANVRDS